MAAAFEDLGTFVRFSLSRQIKLMRGDLDGAIRDTAVLLREVSFVRESMAPYDRVDRMIRAHQEALSVHRHDDQMPERLILFIGQSRSGHSLVGSLIDAHPNAIVAHEIFALKHLLRGQSFAKVVRAIKYNAHFFDFLGRSYTGYDYEVPGQFQGRYRHLKLVGDKKGNATTRLLGRRPEAYDWLVRNVPVPVFFVHVIRNPYDNIATKSRRTGVTLAQAAEGYFANAEVISRLKARAAAQIFDIYLDDLVARPRETIADLLGQLELPPDDGYLDACAAIVFTRPSRTSGVVAWDSALLASIEQNIERHAFLHRYLGNPPA